MGGVRTFSRAYELLILVDQIHTYTERQHRKFVMQHLHAWYVWYSSQYMETNVEMKIDTRDDNGVNNDDEASKDNKDPEQAKEDFAQMLRET